MSVKDLDGDGKVDRLYLSGEIEIHIDGAKEYALSKPAFFGLLTFGYACLDPNGNRQGTEQYLSQFNF